MPDNSRETELLTLLQARDEEIGRLKEENALLRQRIDLLVRQLFGPSSEKLDPAQLQLLLGMEDAAGKAEASAPAAEAVPASSRAPSHRDRRGHKPRVPADLPVLEEIIEPEEVKAEPQAWRCIGAEISEQLDYEPARFLVRRQIRRKFVHRTQEDATPVIAELPPKLQERCLAAPGLPFEGLRASSLSRRLAQIIVAKYCDHLPLYRQESIYESRHGVFLPRQTQALWVGMVAYHVKPIYDFLRLSVFEKGYAQVDETPIEYLSPGHGKTKLGYLWTYHRPGGDTYFDWQTHSAMSSGPNGWTHARRGFRDALESAPRDAALILQQLSNLYGIEARLRQSRAGPKLRAIVRDIESRPIIARLEKTLRRWKEQKRHLPQSAMGGAIDYALGQWSALQVYLSNGRVEIDNNLVENAIRPTAIGKKNWLFIGEAAAGERGAILYTLVESPSASSGPRACRDGCRRRGLNPFRYLRDVLTALPTMTNWQIKDWTPEAWAKRQRPGRKAA